MAGSFGEMLRERRRSLGLSIQQVANTIKMRPQIIEYFETSNFSAMPPRGYAQGMISSYARYLGLNPRDVVNSYLDELYVFERTGNGEAGHHQDPASFVSARSDSSNGRFMIVDGGASPSPSRFGQRPPQAGYVSDSTTGHSSLRVSSNPRRRQALLAGRSADTSNRYGDGGDPSVTTPMRRTSSMRSPETRALPAGSRDSRGSRSARPDGSRARGQQRSSAQQRSGRRNGTPPNRYGQGGYRSRGGQPASRRGDIQSRRGGNQNRRSNGYGRGSSRNSGFPSLLSNPRIFFGGIAVILVLLIILIVSLVRGCSSSASQQSTAETQTTTSSTTSSKSSSTSKSSSDDDDDGADTNFDSSSTDNADTSDSSDASTDSPTDGTDSTADDTAAATTTVTEATTIKVSLAKGKTSWIEVKVDGVSQYADTPVGPYEAEYTPSKSIEITVDNPSDVTVTNNGSKVRWDSKTSGVGRVAITVPQATTSSSSSEPSDNTSSSGTSDSTASQ